LFGGRHQVQREPWPRRPEGAALGVARRSAPSSSAVPAPRVRHELGECDRLEAEAEGVGLDAAELEQVVDERGEAVGLALDRGQVPLDRLGVVHDPVVQGFDHGPDARQRGAQVVRHPGDELAPRPLDPLLPSPGLVEPLTHGLELVSEPRQLLRRRGRDRRPCGLVGPDAAGDVAERAAGAIDLLAEVQRGEHGDDPGTDQDHEQRLEVVGRDEHGLRRDHGAEHGAADRHQHHDDRLAGEASRPAPSTCRRSSSPTPAAEVLAAEHLAVVAHQEGQQLELARRERDHAAGHPHLARGDIDLDRPAVSSRWDSPTAARGLLARRSTALTRRVSSLGEKGLAT
jgi:hypothetical protein